MTVKTMIINSNKQNAYNFIGETLDNIITVNNNDDKAIKDLQVGDTWDDEVIIEVTL